MPSTAHHVVIRPMQPADVPGAERLSSAAYLTVDQRHGQRAWPEPDERAPDRGAAWTRRTGHLLRTDPQGCWVAEAEGSLAGFAVSFTRELMWGLSSYAVLPDAQGRGIGTQLLAAALHHGRGCLRGMLSASADPRAVRGYRLAGFTLHPQMMLTGVVERDALPVVERVREGSAADIDLMDSIGRQTRGAAHGPDHELLLAEHRLLVADRTTGSGFAYFDTSGAPVLLAATNRRTAADLLWEALASTAPGATVTVPHLTAANEWAVDVGLAARLDLHQEGYLGLRGLKPPAPYLHHAALL